MKGKFRLNEQDVVVEDESPTTTLLEYLRAKGLTGTKEGCAEGDCGACTVALLDAHGESRPRWRGVCSCIMMLPQVFDKTIVTVEGLADENGLHPAQEAMVDALGSQCGYCTPGFVMSLFEGTYRDDLDENWKLDDQICGNLCRCTGYRPIQKALVQVAGTKPNDRFERACDQKISPEAVLYESNEGRYARPVDFDALWDELDRPDCTLVNGSTDLGLWVTQKHQHFKHLVDLGGIAELRRIQLSEDGVFVGAGVILSDLESWSVEHEPALAKMLRYFASRQIKNRATIGGNLCNASPIGDLPPVMLGLDAVAEIRSRRGTRMIPFGGDALDKPGFWLDYRKTALAADEILYGIHLPRRHPNDYVASYKVSKRKELDISAVSSTFAIRLNSSGEVEHIRLAYGGMAATPLRAYGTESALLGRALDESAIQAATDALNTDFSPLSDHRGTAWYRKEVAINLFRGFLHEFDAKTPVKMVHRPSGTILSGDES